MRFAFSMRFALAAGLALPLAGGLGGCLIDRGAISASPIDADTDAAIGLDAASPADAYIDPTMDAWQLDAWAPDAPPEPSDTGTPLDTGIDAAMPIDAFTPSDAGCTPTCEGTMLRNCDGTTSACVACGVSTAVTEPHCLQLVPSNAGTVDLYSGSVPVNISSVVTWDTTNCGSGLAGYPASIGHRVTVEGVNLCVVLTSSFTVSGELRVWGDRALVVLARDAITVTGMLTVASHNNEAASPCSAGFTGAGARSGARSGSDGAAVSGEYQPDTGGGGGGFCGSGGRGGRSTEGGTGGAGGIGASAEDMVPLVGGFGGGNGNGAAGEGGAGGGAIQLSAPTVTISGRIVAHGAGGRGGDTGGTRNLGAAGGGGSGGAIHLEALALDLTSTSMLDVRGGGGGAAACWNGSARRGHCGVATTAPMATAGTVSACSGMGSGGQGASVTAADGLDGDAAFDGHGGGGGAGCVLLRSQRPTTATPTLAPSVRSILSDMPPNVR